MLKHNFLTLRIYKHLVNIMYRYSIVLYYNKLLKYVLIYSSAERIVWRSSQYSPPLPTQRGICKPALGIDILEPYWTKRLKNSLTDNYQTQNIAKSILWAKITKNTVKHCSIDGAWPVVAKRIRNYLQKCFPWGMQWGTFSIMNYLNN